MAWRNNRVSPSYESTIVRKVEVLSLRLILGCCRKFHAKKKMYVLARLFIKSLSSNRWTTKTTKLPNLKPESLRVIFEEFLRKSNAIRNSTFFWVWTFLRYTCVLDKMAWRIVITNNISIWGDLSSGKNSKLSCLFFAFGHLVAREIALSSRAIIAGEMKTFFGTNHEKPRRVKRCILCT